MKWPEHLDYVEAIQHPAFCFGDPALRQARPVCDRFGVPRAAAGNFACVFQVVNGGERWAVRCFTRAVPKLRRRYAALARHLSGASTPSLVEFTYVEEGIRIRGAWHPVLRMEWVEGVTLPEYVEAHLGRPEELRQLRRAWDGVERELREQRVAHGDLQHGNLLVQADGRIRLVDYDAMFVPAFRGEPSPELGHPNWQHPRRTERDYDETLDDFASLVLDASLEALAAEPSLWRRFHNGENLIFTREDFQSPQQSELFRLLARSPDRGVRALARDLAARSLDRSARGKRRWPRVRAGRAASQRAAVAGASVRERLLRRLHAALISLLPFRCASRPARHREQPCDARHDAAPPKAGAVVPWYLAELPADAPQAPPARASWRTFRQRMARDRHFARLVWVCAICGGLDLVTLALWMIFR